MGVKRSDTCPSCGATLRYEPPDGYGMTSGSWVCPRCKYRRYEGSPVNQWKFLKKKKEGEVAMTNQEAIDIIKNAIAEVEWEYTMDYAAAFDMAVKALENQEPVDAIAQDAPIPIGATVVRFFKKHWCGKCRTEITYNCNYCPNCGKPVRFPELPKEGKTE